jgi:hypothetical protein
MQRLLRFVCHDFKYLLADMSMYKNILLINPWIVDFSAYDYWIKPLGLLYMASYLRENGMNVQFIDCLNPQADCGITDTTLYKPQRKPGGHGKFLKEIIPKPEVFCDITKPYNRYGMSPASFKEILKRSPKPDLILITAMMTYWYPGAFDVIKIVKDHFPDIPVILGGNYVTLCPEHARKSGADYLLSGEGERHIPFIVQKLLESPLVYQPDLHHLDALPYPAFDLLLQPDQVPMLTSRGCPFHCPYCASHRLYPNFSRRDPLKVVEEMAYWEKHLGIKDFSFYDDALFTSPERMAIPLMREILNRGLSLHFHCPNGLHLREVTPALADLMFQSGFKTLRFGFETSDLKRQREMGGKVNNSHLEKTVAYLRKAGYDSIEIGIYILCGLPGQTEKEIYDTIRYVQSAGAKPILAEFSPIPGTDLWQEAADASPFPIAEEPLFQNNSLLPCRNDSLTLSRYQELKKLTRASSI